MNTILPIQKTETITKELKIGDKNFIVRPWLTKEEKNFLIEKSIIEKKNKEPGVNEIYNLLIKTLVKPCVINGDIDNLSFDEVRYLIVFIKKISSGEVIEDIVVKCPSCNTPINLNVNLDNIEFKEFDRSIKKINDNLSIKFKPIPFKMIKENEDDLFYLYNSIDEIIIDDIVYKNFTRKNWDEYLDSLSISDSKKIGEVLSECFTDFKIKAQTYCIKKDCKHSFESKNPIILDLSDKENFYLP